MKIKGASKKAKSVDINHNAIKMHLYFAGVPMACAAQLVKHKDEQQERYCNKETHLLDRLAQDLVRETTLDDGRGAAKRRRRIADRISEFGTVTDCVPWSLPI